MFEYTSFFLRSCYCDANQEKRSDKDDSTQLNFNVQEISLIFFNEVSHPIDIMFFKENLTIP